MATPKTRLVRRFSRSATQRRDEARVLFKSELHTGAVYLAGYGVECILKALILAITPPTREAEALALFRGAKAHDYNQLKAWYRERGGPAPPSSLNPAFTIVGDWSTDLRYSTATLKEEEALEFLGAVDEIIQWAAGRL
ncbi:HEPN domain-containing protein [Paludisphaera sp.]|uniref:HEPN domain-containing protein n=1 Tax=Paludisphaera sp. TaxID=2017432 RepID=UPI00301C678F